MWRLSASMLRPMVCRVIASLGLTAMLTALSGCGDAGPRCMTGLAMGLSPASGMADHSMKSPLNQQHFQASVGVVLLQQGSGSCPIPQVVALVHPQWTNPDPAHLTISSADDSTNGLATCTGTTAGAVTLTATLPAGSSPLGTTTVPLTATTQVTCK